MSKSLKNFITIAELLNDKEGSASFLSSPADDFRLWCLGLSGSYRDDAATYASHHLQQARQTREKILRFLLDGEAWLYRRNHLGSQHAGRSSNPKLTDRDRDFLFMVQETSAKMRRGSAFRF
jgi:cysteinyl-tRNA synthetase